MGELYKIFSGQTPFRGDSENFINTTTAWIKTTDLANTLITSNEEDISNKAKEKLKIFPVGTVLIAMYGGFNQIGRTGLLTYPATINQAISALPPIAQVNSYFLITELNKRVKEWERFAASSRKDPNITKRDVGDFKLKYPTLEEQNKIGIFFKKIDNTIALHQEKLSKLQSLKKAALQSLFPQKNETEPKVRFANFTDRWSSYKIKDIFLERVEKNGEGELISVTINSGVVKASELDRKDNSSSNKTNYKRIKRHDIVYNSMRMWQGASGYSPYNGIVSPAYTVITPKPGINSKFFSFMFKKNEMIQNFKRNSQGLTSDTWNLKFPALSSIKVKVPKTEEQDKIEQYMTNLDSIIKLYQIKLENLQGIKKALLQKMFI
ncbi:hypothetical protein TEHN7126_2283 [Tetragenococcus halophilus subsp. halophilus]|nr:hypothetical protein TEHN7126_2283 [Tetragenococcus halophilus subsp. halophilus]